MKKLSFLLVSLFVILTCVGCENTAVNTNNEESNNNTINNVEVVKKNTKVICEGPMVGNMFSSMEDVIKSDSMQMIGEYDSDEKFIKMTYVYKLEYAMEFTGSSLETLKTSMNKVCDNKLFSDCNVDVTSTTTVITADLDMTSMSETEKAEFTKDKFREQVKLIGSSFTCNDEESI